ncbi:MAG: hypothetical protein ACO3YA_04400 [Candidatus Nanopelagicaceae bacterium]
MKKRPLAPHTFAPLTLAVVTTMALIVPNTFPAATSLTSTIAPESAAKEKKEEKDKKNKQDKKKKQTQKEKAAAKAKKARQAKRARLNPQISPAPAWPPKGFTQSNGIYAKIPSKKELAGLVSARTALFEAIKPCDEFACGSVIVASAEKCLWWEVLSTVTGPKLSDSATITSYGSLTTKAKGTDSRDQKVILLISQEPVADQVRVSNINVTCHRSGKKGKSGSTYLPFEERG